MSVLPVGIGADSAAGSYQIERSLRFNDDDSAYLNRTPASAGNRKTFTWSGWAKRSQATDANGDMLFSGRIDDNNRDSFGFASGIIQVFNVSSGSVTTQFDTIPVFRDSSAWYHVVFSVDTTQATEANRFKIYVNGSQITQFSTANYPSQNEDFFFNSTGINYIGVYGFSTLGGYFDGYLTEINFIDGSALTPSSFGEYNSDTGVWQPKAYTGSYGTNGFYLNFSDNSGVTSTTLGADSSGNGNNWTPNNFSVTAGAGNDSLVDTPTPYGTDTGLGGEVRGNYATVNPLDNFGSGQSVTNGNLQYARSGTGWASNRGTISVSSGMWYFEAVALETLLYLDVGVAKSDYRLTSNYFGADSSSWVIQGNGDKVHNNSFTNLTTAYTTNDIIMVAFDVDGGKIWFGKNGTWLGSGNPSAGTNAAFTNLSAPLSPAFSAYDEASGIAINFGQRPFAYTAPSGFKALCTQNLPEPTIVDGGEYFNTVLYTGNGSTQSITGVGFQPDFTWIKARSAAGRDHRLTDAVRGVTKELYSSLTNAEATEVNGLTAFNSDGFSIGSAAAYNENAQTFVGWNWKANGAGVSNTAGTITSTVSVDTTSGFSIVTYTGTGSAATVGHGLGAVPAMIITKNRSSGSTDWTVWHQSNSGFASSTGYIYLNKTDAAGTTQVFYNGLAMTSSSYGIDVNSGGSAYINQSGQTYVAYCFAQIPGYSAFGSYTGNGSADGSFIYTGFRPSWVMIKQSSASGEGWYIVDTARDTYNAMGTILIANDSGADNTSQYPYIDYVSNGFKLRKNWAGVNGSGSTYIYMAFAENPFKYSLAR